MKLNFKKIAELCHNSKCWQSSAYCLLQFNRKSVIYQSEKHCNGFNDKQPSIFKNAAITTHQQIQWSVKNNSDTKSKKNANSDSGKNI